MGCGESSQALASGKELFDTKDLVRPGERRSIHVPMLKRHASVGEWHSTARFPPSPDYDESRKRCSTITPVGPLHAPVFSIAKRQFNRNLNHVDMGVARCHARTGKVQFDRGTQSRASLTGSACPRDSYRGRWEAQASALPNYRIRISGYMSMMNGPRRRSPPLADNREGDG